MKKIANIPSNVAKIYTLNNYSTPYHIQVLEKSVLRTIFTDSGRLIVTMPPRHGKSEYISKFLPAWYLLNFPEKRVILTSYEATFASDWCYKAREVYQHLRPFFNAPNLKIERMNYWLTEQNGSMNAIGAGGAITGKGADLLIIDDPIKNAEQALSSGQREKLWEWFNAVALTRLEPDGKIIIVQTRWHEDDLAGRLLKTSDKWDLLKMPAINDDGKALWEERFSVEYLLEIKRQIGTYWWNCLYQQEPISETNQIFKSEYWQYYNQEISSNFIIQSWDTAFKTSSLNDYTVCTTWAVEDGKYYLLDLYRGKIEFPDLVRQVKAEFDKYKPRVILIEDAASGQSLIQQLRRDTALPIKPVKAEKDKVVRANLILPLLENGLVYLPSNSIKTRDVVEECASFPLGAHDDIVDSITQALSYLQNINPNNNKGIGVFNFKSKKSKIFGALQ